MAVQASECRSMGVLSTAGLAVQPATCKHCCAGLANHMHDVKVCLAGQHAHLQVAAHTSAETSASSVAHPCFSSGFGCGRGQGLTCGIDVSITCVADGFHNCFGYCIPGLGQDATFGCGLGLDRAVNSCRSNIWAFKPLVKW
jgi:hypothetical protein